MTQEDIDKISDTILKKLKEEPKKSDSPAGEVPKELQDERKVEIRAEKQAPADVDKTDVSELEQRIAELSKQNADLKKQFDSARKEAKEPTLTALEAFGIKEK